MTEKYTETALGLADPTTSQESPPDQVQQVAVSIDEVQENARTSLDFLAALALPTVFRYFFPPVFKAIWSWLLSYLS